MALKKNFAKLLNILRIDKTNLQKIYFLHTFAVLNYRNE